VAKGVLLLVLAGVKALGEAFLAGGFNLGVVYAVLINVVIAVVMYFGLYKPQTASGASVANWSATHGVSE
jgi:hypothetical protein